MKEKNENRGIFIREKGGGGERERERPNDSN